MSCQIVCYCVSNCWQKRTIARCILLTKLESLVEKSGVGGVILLSPTFSYCCCATLNLWLGLMQPLYLTKLATLTPLLGCLYYL